ncbi:hypothetical protein [Calothrix sp. CCY 0018]|uniref:hypothetical protein n=1 Tax=Calothrix sp. CCY 0018 TaxID=3103864 RepID=UPI0039C6D1B4
MTDSVQPEIILSDKQIAEQLEKLAHKIQEGIDKAYQVLKQAEQIKQEIELQKAEFNPTVEKAISIGEQIQDWEEALNTVAEVADKATIQRLEQEIELASNQINEVQAQVRHTDKIFDAFMSELQKRLVEVSQLKNQIEADKKVVEDLAKETDDKYQQILQMFYQICEQQKAQVVSDVPSEILKSPASIDDDLFSELDSHVELDRKG